MDGKRSDDTARPGSGSETPPAAASGSGCQPPARLSSSPQNYRCSPLSFPLSTYDLWKMGTVPRVRALRGTVPIFQKSGLNLLSYIHALTPLENDVKIFISSKLLTPAPSPTLTSDLRLPPADRIGSTKLTTPPILQQHSGGGRGGSVEGTHEGSIGGSDEDSNGGSDESSIGSTDESIVGSTLVCTDNALLAEPDNGCGLRSPRLSGPDR
jgi:hypothetical protein